MLDLSLIDPKPPGFGYCAVCPYRETGPSALCYSCASKSVENLVDHRCLVCDRPFDGDERECRNILCRDEERWFSWNYAVAMRSGILQKAINQYKYDNRRNWALIFGRVIVGFFEEYPRPFDAFDLIVASPTFVADDGTGRTWDHTRHVIQAAHDESGGAWPFDVGEPPAVIKTAATSKMMGKTWRERHQIAENELRRSLRIPQPELTRGKKVLVYDDVFTDGHTLNEVARALRLRGDAEEVCGVTLARQPWGRPQVL